MVENFSFVLAIKNEYCGVLSDILWSDEILADMPSCLGGGGLGQT
jgi:hypothetical protein